MGLNLHAVVRRSINAIHPDEEVQLLHSTGSVPDENGFAAPQYERTMGVMAQVQSEGDAALFHADMAGLIRSCVSSTYSPRRTLQNRPQASFVRSPAQGITSCVRTGLYGL